MIRLNIACGPNLFPGWVNLDRVDQSGFLHAMATAGSTTGWPEWQKRLAVAAQLREVTCSVWDLRRGFTEVYANDSVDCIYFGQAIEHLNVHYEVPKFLHECLRMLKPGGAIRITTPNIEALLEAWVAGRLDSFESDQPAFFKGADATDQLCYLMFGASGPDCTHSNYEGHFHLYTPDTLMQRLHRAGFYQIRSALKTEHPEFFHDVVDQGMSYAFAMESVKP